MIGGTAGSMLQEVQGGSCPLGKQNLLDNTYSKATTVKTLSDSAAMIFISLSYTKSAHVVHQWLISQKSY